MKDSDKNFNKIPQDVEILDVLIIGAGISGIDAAYHLTKDRPDLRFSILEAKEDIGGTWRTHSFPGIRSDSDLYTFGFKWKPWKGVPIATADEILRYLDEALDENDLRRHIRFGTKVAQAAWSSEDQHWTVEIDNGNTVRARYLWMCAGYYRHDAGYMPRWPGMETFGGTIVHPQNWPDDLDYTNKEIVVIGSGATAATLIPALAKSAAHVTMLQRSPTYFYPRPMLDEFEATLRTLDLPDEWVHEIMRRKFLKDSQETVRRSRDEPQELAAELIAGAKAYLGPDYDVATHFTPGYRPWRQRVAMVPDGDLFVAIREGKASVVTDEIAEFTETGIRLKSGGVIDADIIVSATGLVLNAFGDISLEVDGTVVDPAQTVTHRGIMFTGVPNLFAVFGYLRSSWTLRADLVSDYVLRLISHAEDQGAGAITPELRDEDADMVTRPWIDPENFNAGYVMRALDILPKQGDRQPWILTQDYFRDRDELPEADLDDGSLVYRKAAAPVT